MRKKNSKVVESRFKLLVQQRSCSQLGTSSRYPATGLCCDHSSARLRLALFQRVPAAGTLL